MRHATAICVGLMLVGSTAGAVHWEHPSGFITRTTIAEIRAKLASHEWPACSQ